jgi:hypothetical protein
VFSGGVRSLSLSLNKTPKKLSINTIQAAIESVCKAIKSRFRRVEISEEELQRKATTTLRARSLLRQMQRLEKTVENEIANWVDDVNQMEDRRLQELRSTLDTVSQQLNNRLNSTASIFSLRATESELAALKDLRLTADGRTQKLITAIEAARSEYDKVVYALTDVVRPLSEEELISEFKRVDTPSLQSIRQNITSTVETLIDSGAPLTNTEVDPILEELTSDANAKIGEGINVLDEQIRGGLQRARYRIWSRAKGRVVEKEACKISYKDGSVFVKKAGGAPIEVLSGMDKSLYVDSADTVNMFLGMKTDREAAQHEV